MSGALEHVKPWRLPLALAALLIALQLSGLKAALEYSRDGVRHGEGISGALFGAALILGMMEILAWSLDAGGLPGEARGLGGAVIPQAHLYGAIGGAASVAAAELFKASPSAGISARS